MGHLRESKKHFRSGLHVDLLVTITSLKTVFTTFHPHTVKKDGKHLLSTRYTHTSICIPWYEDGRIEK